MYASVLMHRLDSESSDSEESSLGAAVQVTAVTAAAKAAAAKAAFAVTVHHLLTVLAHLMEWVELILLLLLKRSFKCQYRCMNAWKLA